MTTKGAFMMDRLTKEEQEIERHLDDVAVLPDVLSLKEEMRHAAEAYTRQKKMISIRVSEHDLEVMKIKATRLGIPYQTYINMVIHKDALHL